MSALLLAKIETELLYPPFLTALVEMLEGLQSEGHAFWAVSGFRSEGEQMALWTQGRTKPGLIVTNAKPLQSAHNFGIAVDLVKDKFIERPNLQPDWRPESFEVLDRACRIHGLEWGGWWKFKDRPHVQLPGYVTAKEMEPLAEAWRNTKGSAETRLADVWDAIDAAAEIREPN